MFANYLHAPGRTRTSDTTFATEDAATLWRKGQLAGAGLQRVVADSPRLGGAADELIAGMQTGAIVTRSGDPYKPSAIRSYEQALRDYVATRARPPHAPD